MQVFFIFFQEKVAQNIRIIFVQLDEQKTLDKNPEGMV